MAEQCSQDREKGALLFEPFQTSQDKTPRVCAPPVLANRAGNFRRDMPRPPWIWATFAETKVARPPGRNPASSLITMDIFLGSTNTPCSTINVLDGENPRLDFPKKTVENDDPEIDCLSKVL